MLARAGGVPVRVEPGLTGDHGASLVEIVMALAVVVLLAGLTAPVTAHVVDASRARHAAGFLASRLRLARQLAIQRSASTAIVFDETGGGWTYRVCVDGNGNGLRRTEVTTGVDSCPEGPYDPRQMFSGTAIAIDPSLPAPDGGPGSNDPVRFGRGEMASFSPDGTASAGTVYVRSRGGRQYAIRVGNVTGRTRLLRFDPGRRGWRTGS
jgi:type II secretory pathway pseudopilin PulG